MYACTSNLSARGRHTRSSPTLFAVLRACRSSSFANCSRNHSWSASISAVMSAITVPMHHVLRTWQSRDDRAHHSQYAPRPSPVLTHAEGQGPTPSRPANLRSAPAPWSAVSLAGLLFSRIEIDGNSGGSIRRTRGWAVCSTTGLPSGPPNERRDATESQRPLQEYVTAVRAG